MPKRKRGKRKSTPGSVGSAAVGGVIAGAVRGVIDWILRICTDQA
ncbi:hypothetical protein [Streptomyces sp. NPDC052114]